MMQADPLVAVAIVSWNTRDLLRRCLQSFAPEMEQGRCDVWVVDNASSDGSAEMVRREFPQVTLAALDENLGFGRAVNHVAARTSSPWLAVANADIALRPGALDALIEAAADDPGAGAIAPRLVLPDGSAQQSAFAFPTIGLALIVGLGIGRIVRPLGRRALLLGSFDDRRAQTVPWAVAAFLLVRRAAWDAAGGFDERHWMYAEDLDLGWRLRRCGWRTRYEPKAAVDHHSGAAAEQVWGDSGRTERWQRATYAWMLRRMGPARTRTFAAIQIAGQAARLVLLTPAGRIAPARWGHRRRAARWWIGLHREGLRSLEDLEAGS
jgi:N-acetylglucosaminyl-diphospho-decaprenol L-rhamnosyltransferase